ncbi:hypothetical protein VTJ04DRAFT_1882 [Mycothermus thermophilus]|uniref:uncharacterized protein n=1 Tax=Humicola insolens TaxID=85995 RepID=UPI00374456A5
MPFGYPPYKTVIHAPHSILPLPSQSQSIFPCPPSQVILRSHTFTSIIQQSPQSSHVPWSSYSDNLLIQSPVHSHHHPGPSQIINLSHHPKANPSKSSHPTIPPQVYIYHPVFIVLLSFMYSYILLSQVQAHCFVHRTSSSSSSSSTQLLPDT